MVRAIEGGVELDHHTTEDDNSFITFLGEWQLMIGDTRKSSSKDHLVSIMLIKDKLKEFYPKITLPEIKLAVKLSMANELDITAEIYNNQSFSVLYCTRIINAYLEYKKEMLIPVFKRWEAEPPAPTVWTVEQKLQQTVDIFKDEYDHYLKNGLINDPLNICYNFLNDTKRFNLMTDQVAAAQNYGKTMAIEFLKREDGSVKEALEKMKHKKLSRGTAIDVEKLEKSYARNYCVQEHFKKLTNIEELIGTFKPDEFVQVYNFTIDRQKYVLIPDMPGYAGLKIKKKGNLVLLGVLRKDETREYPVMIVKLETKGRELQEHAWGKPVYSKNETNFIDQVEKACGIKIDPASTILLKFV